MELTPGRVSEIRRSVLPVVRFATPTDFPVEIDLGDVGAGVAAKVVLEKSADAPAPEPAEEVTE